MESSPLVPSADPAMAGFVVRPLRCLRYCNGVPCGHVWYPRTPKRPKVCPRCKSMNWDEPHTESELRRLRGVRRRAELRQLRKFVSEQAELDEYELEALRDIKQRRDNLARKCGYDPDFGRKLLESNDPIAVIEDAELRDDADELGGE